MKNSLRCAALAFWMLPLVLDSQTAPPSQPPAQASAAPAQSAAPSQSAAPRRTFLQWTEMKGMRSQIFIDLNTRGQSVYRGANSDIAATLLVQLPGDGSVELLEYAGSGDDWKWTPVEAHAVLSHPSPGLDRVDFDYLPLAPNKKLTVQFRSLGKDWQVVSASKVLPWQPS